LTDRIRTIAALSALELSPSDIAMLLTATLHRCATGILPIGQIGYKSLN